MLSNELKQKMNYSNFAKTAFKEFHQLQKKFREENNLDDYTAWFYNQTTQLLTLSKEGAEINFKYIPVGTFSEKSNTWMWAWQNQTSTEKDKMELLKVKALGEKWNFEKLTEGHFEGDKYTGWEMTSIAHQVLKGIGGYRAKAGQLELYFLLIKQVPNEVATKMKEELIDCQLHGSQRMAFVCQHLKKDVKTGFEEAFPSSKGMELEEEEDFQAWCNECESMRIQEDGWTEKATKFANIKAVCENCYFEMKEFNLE